jgi:hypothetical protein
MSEPVYTNLQQIVDQLQFVGFETDDGFHLLENSAAFIALKERAKRESVECQQKNSNTNNLNVNFTELFLNSIDNLSARGKIHEIVEKKDIMTIIVIKKVVKKKKEKKHEKTSLHLKLKVKS